MTLKDVKNRNAEVYNSTFQKMYEKFEAFGPRFQDIKNVFELYGKKDTQNLSVLELGCFYGREYKAIEKYTSNYTGVDISEVAISHAKTNFPEVDFICEDMEDFIPSKKYDIVLAFASLIHSDYESTEKLFLKIFKILNNEGICYISMKKSSTYIEVEKDNGFGVRKYYHYSVDNYKNIIGDNFEIIYLTENFFSEDEWFTMCFRKK